MGCGEENLFSKRFLPHKTVLQHSQDKIGKKWFEFDEVEKDIYMALAQSARKASTVSLRVFHEVIKRMPPAPIKL